MSNSIQSAARREPLWQSHARHILASHSPENAPVQPVRPLIRSPDESPSLPYAAAGAVTIDVRLATMRPLPDPQCPLAPGTPYRKRDESPHISYVSCICRPQSAAELALCL